MNLIIRASQTPPRSQEIEVVERKGLGHPDTICDAIAEEVCVHLCRAYLERFGRIVHHNVDKVLLVGGSARPSFGGGEIIAPIEIYLAGRATQEYRDERIPIEEIAVEACREWLRKNLHHLDIHKGVKIIPRLRSGSADLTRLFGEDGQGPLSNDTSCGAGFAPLTDLERIVLEVEHGLNSRQTKRVHPEIGEDVKVMGVRCGDRINLTISCALVDRFVQDIDDYVRKKDNVQKLALEIARRFTRHEVHAIVNAADDVKRESVFLTVTGTSAEAGDDGEVGRGNRTSGLITPYRKITLEAAAGKNPIIHVGKLYNLLAGRIAAALVSGIPSVTDAECLLVSQIGRPVSDPQLIDVSLAMSGQASIEEARGGAAEIVNSQFERFSELRAELLQGRVTVY